MKQDTLMHNKQNNVQLFWSGLIQAGMFTSRLPLQGLISANSASIPLGKLVGFFPVWGAVMAFIGIIIVAPMSYLGLPMPAVAILAVLSVVALSGALHEDGLADCMDGWFGGHNPEQRLNIMKDSRLGSYGCLALISSILMRLIPLALLSPLQAVSAFIVCHTLPRGLLGIFWYHYPRPLPRSLINEHAKTSLAEESPTMPAMVYAVILSISFSLLVLPMYSAFLCIFSTFLGMLFFAKLSMRKVGGLNGDSFGALEQIGEIIVLWVLCLLAYSEL